MAKKKKEKKQQDFKKTLWQTADKLRKNMDAAEYKHIVLGLIFLKYISDSFKELYTQLQATKGADPEDPDEYRAENVFYVPPQARWDYLLSQAKQTTIGKTIDAAMDAIEMQNPNLKGILPKQYARTNLHHESLGGLIDLIGTVALGDAVSRSRDILGEVYEFFLGQFALAEGKQAGQYYTPRSVVTLLVEMLEPYNGRVFDPCCGSGGMFVMSEKFVVAHQGKLDDISIFGQESNQTTYRLARMNLALRGIDGGNIRWNTQGSFLKDAHPDLKADFILSNPPFNDSDWSGDQLKKDGRWKYGVPPASNANFAWMQHFIYHLSPKGTAGFVMADTTLSTLSASEETIRMNIVKEGLVDCIVALPSHLFTNTQITACLWFLARNKKNGKYRNRSNEVLFIDASKLGVMKQRKQRELSDNDIKKIASTYHHWRNTSGRYKDSAGFCKSVQLEEIIANNYVVSPNRYVVPLGQVVDLKIDFNSSEIPSKLSELSVKIQERVNTIQTTWSGQSYTKLNEPFNLADFSNEIESIAKLLFKGLLKKYFLDFQLSSGNTQARKTQLGNIPVGWSVKPFGELFVESSTKVKDIGYCPPIYSVTNLGIQPREGKYSKELSKSTSSYKVAYLGDMVFGLSREIPNLDVFSDSEGAFSGAYHIFRPKDKRIGLIVGNLMRMKLSEQVDILRGGAREGRGLDKEKLMKKLFPIPPDDQLDQLWDNEE